MHEFELNLHWIPNAERERKVNDSKTSETASLNVTVKPASEWDKKLSALRESSMRMVKTYARTGASVQNGDFGDDGGTGRRFSST